MASIKPQVERGINHRFVHLRHEWADHYAMASELGSFIIRRLDEEGHTQAWLAEQMGVSDNAVSKWIRSGKISRDNFFKLLDKIGSSGAPYIWDAVAKKAENNHHAVAFTDDEKLILEGFRLADESTRRNMVLLAADVISRLGRRREAQ